MRRLFLPIAGLLLIVGSASAQDNPLYQYIEQALGRNLQLEISRSGIAVARKEREAAAAAFYPTVDFGYRLTRINRAATIDLDIPSLGADFEIPEIFGVWQWQAMFQMKAPIYLAGTLRDNLQLRSAAETALELNLEAEEREIVLSVVSVYLDLKMARALIEVQKASLETARKHQEAVAAMLEQGMVSLRELKRAEAIVADVESKLIAAENALQLAQRSFNFILNRELEAEVDLSGELGWSQEYRLDEAISNALDARSELAAVGQRLVIGDKQIDLARAAYLPSFYAAADGGWRYGDIQAISGKDYWSVSVIASINIFDSSRDEKLAAARASRRREELILESMRRRIELEVTDSYLRLADARKRQSAAERARIASEEARRVADLQFKQGVIDQVTYLDAELALTAAKVQEEQARYSVLKSEAALRYSAGYSIP